MRGPPQTGPPEHSEEHAQVTLDEFLAASAVLTGFERFDLLGTGQAGKYFALVVQNVGNDALGTLCDRVAAGDVDAVMADTAGVGQLARAVITLWYFGAWGTSPSIVDAETYSNGLIWDLFGGHPPAARQQGYGAWAAPPR